MARYFDVHPENPQPRSIDQVVEILLAGGLIAYPTDSGFALGAIMGNKQGLDRIRKIRQLSQKHNFTVVLSKFAQVGQYVDLSNQAFRIIKSLTPGPYTFIVKATKEVPRMTWQPNRHTIGIRVPNHVTALALLDRLGQPIVSSSLIMPGEEEPMSDGWQIKDLLDYELDAVLDSADVGSQATTVVDFSDGDPQLIRLGAGDVSWLG